jgi:hypothetical protein
MAAHESALLLLPTLAKFQVTIIPMLIISNKGVRQGKASASKRENARFCCRHNAEADGNQSNMLHSIN